MAAGKIINIKLFIKNVLVPYPVSHRSQRSDFLLTYDRKFCPTAKGQLLIIHTVLQLQKNLSYTPRPLSQACGLTHPSCGFSRRRNTKYSDPLKKHICKGTPPNVCLNSWDQDQKYSVRGPCYSGLGESVVGASTISSEDIYLFF